MISNRFLLTILHNTEPFLHEPKTYNSTGLSPQKFSVLSIHKFFPFSQTENQYLKRDRSGARWDGYVAIGISYNGLWLRLAFCLRLT